MHKPKMKRRNFFANSLLATSGLMMLPQNIFSRSLTSPGNKIHLAFIGTGKQSVGLVNNFINRDEVKIIAGSDVDKDKLTRFKNQVENHYASTSDKSKYSVVKTYEDYRDLLGRDDIDAVVIATPDHWHALQSIEAMKTGKDVYCEKPLAHTIEEGRAMANAAMKYNSIVQTGSMQRSWTDFRHACELVRNGYIGDVSKILVSVGGPAIPCTLPDQKVPDKLNWDMWLGPAPNRGYNEVLSPPIEHDHWPRWRDYKEYGGGTLADWGAHMFDIAQWAMGTDQTGPTEIIPPTDPDVVYGLRLLYETGVEVEHTDFDRGYAVRFIGSEGTIDVSRSFLDSKPENIVTASIKVNETRLYYSDDHYQNWLDCMKSRKQPVTNAETGHRTATICNIGNIAYWLRKPLQWNPDKEEFVDNEEANKLRGKKYRDPWKLYV